MNSFDKLKQKILIENLERNSYKEPHDPSLEDAIMDAYSLLRYFKLRDEMNAETHYEYQCFGVTPKVRYSPITFSAERVVVGLYNHLFKEPYNFFPLDGSSEWTKVKTK